MSEGAIDDLPPFAMLVDNDAFREVCKSYSALYGVGIKVFDVLGQKIVDMRANNVDHCGYLFSVPATRLQCTALVNHIKACPLEATLALATVDCFSGLRYKIMPVLHEGAVIGRVIFGPFAPPELTAPPAALDAQAPALQIDRLASYLAVIPQVADLTAAKILENIRQVLDLLIHASYKAALTGRMHIASISGAFADLEKSNHTLRAANTRLRELDQLKSNFIATVSHELRTPLTSVIGYSELLLQGLVGTLTPEQQTYVGTILEKGESLLGLISQILDLARIESGNVAIRKELLDPVKLVQLSVTDVVPQARKRLLSIALSAADDVTPIEADADKVRRIITNLLSNAVKFTPAGGQINVRLDVILGHAVGEGRTDPFEPERNRYLRLQVQDTGIGIPADKRERVFETFYQVDNGATREFGGTGLGLSIVRNFVQAHGGRVAVQSEEGSGSTFVVCLPYVAEPVEEATPVGVDGLSLGLR